jgi:hypothetical protein
MIRSKIVGLELIGIFQLAFFILATQSKINPILSPLANWDYINGYNFNYLKNVKNMP